MAQQYIFMFCLLYYFISPSTLLTDLPGMPMMCLEQRTYEWDMRAAVKCRRQELYHCLQHINNTKRFYEFCGNFTYISQGNYPVYNPTSKAIREKPCPNNTYQDTLLKSSDLNSCLVKTDCTGIGSLVCSNGSPSEDRRCKCDIMKGMVILSYGDKPGNTDICCPYEDPACMCWSKHCQRDKELNEVYQCVRKCKPGFHRPNWTSECILSGSTNSNTSIGTILLSSPTSTKDNVGNTDLVTTTSIPGMDMSMMMSIITIEAIFGVLIAIAVLQVVKFFYQHKNRLKKANNTTNVDSTTEQHVELPQTNHGDINIGGNNVVVNIAGDHKGDIYKIKDTKDSAIGKGATIVVTEGPNMDEETNLKNDQRRLSSHEDFSETGAKYVTSDSDEETVLLTNSPSNTEPKYISSHPESLEKDIKHVTSESEY